jgi:uncharacterized membrane protein
MTLAGAFGLLSNLVTLYKSEQVEEGQGQVNYLSDAIGLPAMAAGLGAALFVALMGNLIGVLEVLHKRGLLPPSFWVWLDIRDLKEPPLGPGESWIPDRFIWWWRGSRVLTDYNLAGHEQEVIDEFPFFSFLLGDVHPHVLTLPFALLAVGLALNLLYQPNQGVQTDHAGEARSLIDKARQILENSWRELLAAGGGRVGFIFYALAIGGLSFLNTWDFPIYLSVVGLAFVVRLAQKRPKWQEALWPGLVGTGLLAAAGVILYLPFYAAFQSQARGILPNLWNPTRLSQFFVFFGPFLVAASSLLTVLSLKYREWQKEMGWSLLLTLVGPILALLVVVTGILLSPAGRDYIQGLLNSAEVQAAIGEASIGAVLQASLARRLDAPWTFVLLGGLLGWAIAQLVGLSPPNSPPSWRKNLS